MPAMKPVLSLSLFVFCLHCFAATPPAASPSPSKGPKLIEYSSDKNNVTLDDMRDYYTDVILSQSKSTPFRTRNGKTQLMAPSKAAILVKMEYFVGLYNWKEGKPTPTDAMGCTLPATGKRLRAAACNTCCSSLGRFYLPYAGFNLS